MSTSALILLHAFATLAMTGVIWFVQLVHYPLFRFAAAGPFHEFASSHQGRTSLVVAPLMTLELVTAALIAAPGGPGAPALSLPGLFLLAVIWASTAFVQVPLHRRLARGFDAEAAASLVRTNWVRTAAWSARALLAVALLAA